MIFAFFLQSKNTDQQFLWSFLLRNGIWSIGEYPRSLAALVKSCVLEADLSPSYLHVMLAFSYINSLFIHFN